jgi:AcrR family transcriptional regulator
VPRPRAHLDYAAIAAAFAPDGLHGTTAAEVARRARLAKPTLYARGRSKDAVFLACVEAEVERLLGRLGEAELATRGAPARPRLAAVAGSIIAHGVELPASARLIHATAAHASSTVAGEVEAALARLPARVEAILRAVTTPGCAAVIAPALVGAAGALAMRPPADPAAAAQLLGEAFAAGLEPPAGAGADERVQSVSLY